MTIDNVRKHNILTILILSSYLDILLPSTLVFRFLDKKTRISHLLQACYMSFLSHDNKALFVRRKIQDTVNNSYRIATKSQNCLLLIKPEKCVAMGYADIEMRNRKLIHVEY
jgi:hypothetical protein